MKQTLIKLILQVLNEPRLLRGAYVRFAEVFTQHSGQTVTRNNVYSWLKSGIPATKVGLAEELSVKHAKRNSDRITARDLRPDLYKNNNQL